jgi:anti-sigma B factor antagonist
MEFREETRDQVQVLHLQGKIIGDEQTQMMCARLHNLIAAGMQHLVMDFRETQLINSAGIGTIIACLTALRRRGGDIRFANVHHMAQHYFHITKLETVVQIFDSVAEAVASFVPAQTGLLDCER